MGAPIATDQFDDHDVDRFSARLDENLTALAELLARPGFGEGEVTIGSELELNLVDEAMRPLLANERVLERADDRRVTVELARFNLEVNGSPRPLGGRPFSAMAEELDALVGIVRRAAAREGGRIAMIGMVPTLTERDLTPDALTPRPRYRALSASLRRLKQAPFTFRIDGEDPLDVTADHVLFEGAATSFQVHLRVAPALFARQYNAAQLAIGPALAVATNAPLFLGRRLWDETRIAIFRQATDDRQEGEHANWRLARVAFGGGYIQKSALELFAESVALHRPLLPVLCDEDAPSIVRAGGVPGLGELRLHGSTVYRWNRAIYDPADGGHLRIEVRPLPAGPTTIDVAANAAFVLGLTLGLARDVDAHTTRVTHAMARRNFYEAAQRGLAAELHWPTATSPTTAMARPLRPLVDELLPIARAGLVEHGVAPDEADRLLGVIERRVAVGQNGASWQRRALERLEQRRERHVALPILLDEYMQRSESGEPVATWSLP